MLRTISILTAIVFALGASSAGAVTLHSAAAEASPAAFTLNLVGKEKVMPVPGDAGGNRILVPLWGECRINLSEGDFETTDANCTDDNVAGFQLPNPDPEGDGVSSYRVYVRALAKPGGSATMNTCVEDEDGTWCSTETVFVARAAGQSPSMDVSKEALTVCHDRDGDGTYERETIFSDENAEYFWQYENSGLRLAQLKFVMEPVPINAPCPAV